METWYTPIEAIREIMEYWNNFIYTEALD